MKFFAIYLEESSEISLVKKAMGKIVILGAGGRLGTALAREWSAAGEDVVCFDRKGLPLGDADIMEHMLGQLDFDVLVNCAALTNVDYCETHPEEAFRINGIAANEAALICEQKGARCIHISTDYVFDGKSDRPYRESDTPAPLSVYGASKRVGEDAVLAAGSRHWVVRVAWVFGPDRISFLDQIVSRALSERRVDAVNDKWSSPTHTEEVAKLLWPFLRNVPGGGILHAANVGVCTWQEYGQWALDCAAAAGLPLKATTVGGVPMAAIKAFVAKRPVYTPLDTTKLTQIGRLAPRPWREAVEAYVRSQAEAGVWVV